MNGPPPPNEDPGETPPPNSNDLAQTGGEQSVDARNDRDRWNFIMHELHRRNGIVHVDFLDLNGNQNLFAAQAGNDPNGAENAEAQDRGDIVQVVRRLIAERMNMPHLQGGQDNGITFARNNEVMNSGTVNHSNPATAPTEDNAVNNDGAVNNETSNNEAINNSEQPINTDAHEQNSDGGANNGSGSGSGGDTAPNPGQENSDDNRFGPHRFRPLRHTGTVYFISIHEDDQNSKASERAIQSLRRIPLAEIPAGERDCTICYDPLTDYSPSESTTTEGEESNEDHSALAMPECNHFFGASCLKSWLQSAASCPLCRSRVESDADTRPSRFPRFGTSMPFFFDRLHSQNPSREASQEASPSSTPNEPNRDADGTPLATPQEPSEFEREVTDLINRFRDENAPENTEEHNMAFVRVIEATMRHVANRVGNPETNPFSINVEPTGDTNMNNGENTENTDTTPNHTVSANPATAPEAANGENPQPRAPSGVRSFIGFPQIPIPSLAELRARQSEVMRRAFDRSGLTSTGQPQPSQETPGNQEGAQNETRASFEAVPSPAPTPARLSTPARPLDEMPNPPMEGRPAHAQTAGNQDTGNGPEQPATFTFHIHHPVVLPTAEGGEQADPSQLDAVNSSIFNAIYNHFAPLSERVNAELANAQAGGANGGEASAGNAAANAEPTHPNEQASTAVQENSANDSEDVSMATDTFAEDSQTDGDGDERRSGPSRRSTARHHPYQRNTPS